MKVVLWVLKVFLFVSILAGLLSYGLLADRVSATGLISKHELNVVIPLEAYKIALISLGIFSVLVVVAFFIVFAIVMVSDYFSEYSEFKASRKVNNTEEVKYGKDVN